MLEIFMHYWCVWRHKPWQRLTGQHRTIYFVRCAKCGRETYQDERGWVNNEPHVPDEAEIERQWRQRSGG